jgi:hypothetical protein
MSTKSLEIWGVLLRGLREPAKIQNHGNGGLGFRCLGRDLFA